MLGTTKTTKFTSGIGTRSGHFSSRENFESTGYIFGEVGDDRSLFVPWIGILCVIKDGDRDYLMIEPFR